MICGFIGDLNHRSDFDIMRFRFCILCSEALLGWEVKHKGRETR